jgi:hypothetical protein
MSCSKPPGSVGWQPHHYQVTQLFMIVAGYANQHIGDVTIPGE